MDLQRTRSNMFVTGSVGVALLLAMSGIAVGQRLQDNVYGMVTDRNGNPLPDATATVSGTGRTTAEFDPGRPPHLRKVSITKVPRAEGQWSHVSKISARGVVVGLVSYADGPHEEGVLRWFWRTRKLRDVGGEEMCTIVNRTPLISDDGRIIAATRLVRSETSGRLECIASIWTRRNRWQPLSGLVLRSSGVTGMSRNGTQIVGSGQDDENLWARPWVWSAETGQQVLAVSPEMDGAEAWAIADDGSVVIGHQFQLPYLPAPYAWYYATRWSEDGVRTMRDEFGVPLGEAISCNSDCSVVVGAGQGGEPDFEHPNWGQAWYWTAASGGVYLGTRPDAAPGTLYYATDVNADGSMIVGTYSVDNGNGTISYRGFLWTAQTGMVSILDVLAAHGIDHGSDWDGIIPTAITPSGDMILISGQEADYTPGGFIVHLPPRWHESIPFDGTHDRQRDKG